MKPNPTKRIQRARTEGEMLNAVAQIGGDAQDIDDPEVVLRDCVNELINLRAIVEEVRGFIQTMSVRLQRKS